MKIAVYAPFVTDEDFCNKQAFSVSTFLSLLSSKTHSFSLLTGVPTLPIPCLPPRVDTVFSGPVPKNILLAKLWWDVKLPSLLKKVKAELFISLDQKCSSTAAVPQCMVVEDSSRVKVRYVKKTQLLIVKSNAVKQNLMQRYKISGERIVVFYPPPDKRYMPLDNAQKGSVKKRYSEGFEFFLYTGTPTENVFVNLLKSFSHFKKRQHSSFKLLLIAEQKHGLEKTLATYKYRNDIKFISPNQEEPMIMAAAYGVILPFDDQHNLITGLNAMQAGAPMITGQDAPIKEIAGEAVLYSDNDSIKSLAEKMMQLYTDESYRSGIIEQARVIAATFTPEESTNRLWRSLEKVLE